MNDNGYLLMTMKKTKTKYLSANVSGRYQLGYIPHTI